jgi:hypothetical protein
MKKPKLNLQSLTTMLKVSKTRQIAEAMAISVHFPTPNPALPILLAKAQEVEDAFEAAQTGLNTAQTTLELREKELDTLLTQEAAYVSNIAAGNVEIIESAGMEAGEEPGAPELPDIAQNLKLTDIKNISGSVKALWKSVKKSKSYLVYVAVESTAGTTPGSPTTPSPGTAPILSALPTPPAQPGTSGYTLYDVPTASRITISGLTPGKRIWVVVLVVGAGGKSGFSDPATIIVR